jgi:nitric oxide reductase large subunit
VSLGPTGAHSVKEFILGWTLSFVVLVVVVGVVALFFRDNVLAYVAVAVCLPIVEPLVSLLSQPVMFFRLNGALLALLVLILLGWMLAVGEPAPAEQNR